MEPLKSVCMKELGLLSMLLIVAQFSTTFIEISRVLLTLDHSIMVINARSHIRAAVSGDMRCSSMEHPNGKVYQQQDRVDIVAHDGLQRNKFK